MTRCTVVMAVALAAAGLSAGSVGCDREDRDAASKKVDNAAKKTGDAIETAADKTADATKEVGRDIKDAVTDDDDAKVAGSRDTPGDPTEEIHDVLAQVAETALTKDGLAQMVERFVDADRNRLGIGDGDNLDNGETLDGRIDQFRKDWKAKFNTDFDIGDEGMVFNPMVTIRHGELGKDAAGVEVDVDRKADGTTEVEVDRKSGVDAPGSAAADTNLNDPGRNVATVTLKASHGMPALQVPMIHEAGGWKIDVPDTLTADKLRENVLAHLTAANEAKDQWPANEADAQAAVTHHVLMAVFDKPMQK